MHLIKKLFQEIKEGEPIRIYTALVIRQSVIVCLFVFFAGSVTITLTGRMVTENTGYYAKQLLEETKQRITIAMNEIETLSHNLAKNSEIMEFVLDKSVSRDRSSEKNCKWFTKLSGAVDNIVAYEKGIHSIGIFSNGGAWMYFGAMNDKDIYLTKDINPQYDLLRRSDEGMIWVPTFDLNYGQYQLIALQRKLIDTKSFKETGAMTINVKVQYLNQILASGQLDQRGDICIIDGDGKIVAWGNSTTRSGEIGEKLTEYVAQESSDTIIKTINSKQYLITFDTLKGCDWKVVGILPLEQIRGEMSKNQFIIMLTSLIGLLITLITSAVLASKITAPIDKLTDGMNMIQSGDLSIRVEDNSFIETKKLSDGFNKMLEDINELIIKVYEEQIRERDAKIEALQAQISPHFLYNTLETINALLIIDENYKVSNLVTSLGDIFKYSISGGNKTLTLEEDMYYVQKYLYIQKVRFGENFNYTVNIQPGVEKAVIMKLIIQPIVENAVVHGIEEQIGKAYLDITACVNDNKLVITVSDNGRGIEKEKLEGLLSVDTVLWQSDKHTRIGINNVYNRIKLFYGPEYGLKIESAPGKGTRVEMILPFICEEEFND